MNEIIFLTHIGAVMAAVLIALRLGKQALVVLVTLCGILANLFVVKQMALFGFAVTCSDVFAVGCVLGLNLLQEYYGKEGAREALRIAVGALLFFALMAEMHLLYAPIPEDGTHGAFQIIFASSWRIIAASIGTFYLVQKLDVRFFGWLRGALALRVGVSLLFSELLDTVLFSYLGLYGIVESIGSVMALSFLTKCNVIALSAPFIAFAKRVVKRAAV